jgi:dethiobiotin synthetase
MRGLFVTGTDTGVGKTVVAVALLRALAAAGRRAVGMKPVSAGVDAAHGANADVVALAEASTVDAPIAERNPFAFAPAIAPHLAARLVDRPIDLRAIERAGRRLAQRADTIVVEGAGGALVPLDDRHDMLDIARVLGLPVLLVVGVRLGCLNHARLSALAIRARGLRLAGWVATRIDAAMQHADDNVRWLEEELGAVRIADIADPDAVFLGDRALAQLGL